MYDRLTSGDFLLGYLYSDTTKLSPAEVAGLLTKEAKYFIQDKGIDIFLALLVIENLSWCLLESFKYKI